MNLAAGKAELSACPYVTEEAKVQLEEASAPPIRPVTIGMGDRIVKIGGETVMFRHEKRFENPPGIAILISDIMNAKEIDIRLNKIKELEYERVGVILRAELVALKCESGDTTMFINLIKRTMASGITKIILMTQDTKIMQVALELVGNEKPLLYSATTSNIDDVIKLAKEYNCPFVIKGDDLEETFTLSEKAIGSGAKDIVIDSGARTLRSGFNDSVFIRRAALLQKSKPLGFPTIVFPGEMTENPLMEALYAATFIAKYAGLIVLSDFTGESLFPLLVERLNIFTDPQRPLATTEGIYEIGGPDEESPVALTCNFSLTYFIISGEVESSRIPSYLLIKDTEGLSVMTAWAAGKFSAEDIATFIKKCGIADRVNHRKLIIPGYIAVESGSLEEELPEWEIQIGPREGAHLPAFLKNWRP
jgi:acetyl-CoA decarbonylase/synthase complex subunit gamma